MWDHRSWRDFLAFQVWRNPGIVSISHSKGLKLPSWTKPSCESEVKRRRNGFRHGNIPWKCSCFPGNLYKKMGIEKLGRRVGGEEDKLNELLKTDHSFPVLLSQSFLGIILPSIYYCFISAFLCREFGNFPSIFTVWCSPDPKFPAVPLGWEQRGRNESVKYSDRKGKRREKGKKNHPRKCKKRWKSNKGWSFSSIQRGNPCKSAKVGTSHGTQIAWHLRLIQFRVNHGIFR